MLNHISNTISLTFLIYIVLMLVIGVIAYRRTHNLSDYILGGRRLSSWTAALSAGASDMSGWLLLGLPGFAYASGLQSVWLVAGLLLGGYLNWWVIAGLATWLAGAPQSSVLSLVGYAWAGFGAVFGPALILALYWRNMNRWGALAGMISGGSCVVWWKHMSGGIFDVYELVPGFLCATIAIVLVSLLTGKPDTKVLAGFDKMQQRL